MADESHHPANALGMHANALADASSSRPALQFLTCANPPCQRQFKQVKFWQKYCSPKCRNDVYWAKHKRITLDVTPETNQTKTS